jgi:maleylpyruvate isomerase
VTSAEWTDVGTTMFLAEIDRIPDRDLDLPTELPGWTRRHVVAHVHYNALALGRLVNWAATGNESLMYASAEQRNDEIAQGSTLPAPELRRLVRESAEQLRRAFNALSPDARTTEVVTAQGRTVTITEVPWMRSREVMVHTVDLGTGVTFDDLPLDFVEALIADIVHRRVGNGEGPELAAWLAGRREMAPQLGRWL